MKKVKITLYIMTIACIIVIMISGYFFLRARKFVKIDDENIEIIKDGLQYDIEDENDFKRITKVAYQMVWMSPTIYIYYEPFERIDMIGVNEGKIGGLSNYIRENGHSETTTALNIIFIVLIVGSTCVIALIVIYKNELKNKNML